MEMECVVAGGVGLPAEADDGEAVAEKPRVTGVVLDVPVAAINERDDAAAAAVGVFKEQRAVAAVRIFGANGDEVGGELDFAVAEVDGVFEIDDGGVVGIVYGEREVDGAEDTLAGAGVAETAATQHILARRDFYSCDPRMNG